MSMTSRGFLQRDAAALFGIESIDRKPAKIAFGVADVRDRELQITGAAMAENLPKKLEHARPGSGDRRQGLLLRSRGGHGCISSRK